MSPTGRAGRTGDFVGLLKLNSMGRIGIQFPMGRFLAALLCCFVICAVLSSGIASKAAATQVAKSSGIPNPGGPAVKSPPQSGNFAEFLSAELIQWGGRENKLSEQSLPADWVITRDRFGAAIDVTKGDYQALTNALTGEYGAPIVYIKPIESRPATYLYVASKEGLRLFVKQESKELIEVTITRLFSKE